nr:toprim domain-containing protein [Polymorphobacter sp.]
MNGTTSRTDLDAQGRDIVETRGGKWQPGRGGMCRCPAHVDGDPSLSVRVGDTSLLFHCFAGCTTVAVLEALRRSGDRVRSTSPGTAGEEPATARNLQPLAEKLWASGRGLGRSLAADYLASRHLVSHSAQLRFHGRVQLGPRADATYQPALLAAVRDDIGLRAVHRTFLDPAGGKAIFDNPKRLLANPGRGTVRIGAATRVLGLAEGIESALAASKIHGIPVWAVLGNERFGLVAIPDCVERLFVLADNDAGGERAAKLAVDGQKRDGLTIETLWPPAQHNDWADVLMAGRGEGAAPD